MTERNSRGLSFEESYYEFAELWTDENYGPADQERLATLAAKLPPDVRSLLDVGCGNGLFIGHLNELKGRRFDRLCGTDRSSAALAGKSGEMIQSSIDTLPFLDKEFDAVSCLEVLEHLPHATYATALAELSRIASRYILICVPFNEQLELSLMRCDKCCCRFNPNYHLRAFNSMEVKHLFDDKGFECCEIFYIHLRKVVPNEIEAFLRFMGVIKRALFRQAHQPMRQISVCPACGYSPATCMTGSTVSEHPPPRSVGHVIRSLLGIRRAWRWIGALYVRS